MRAAIAAIRAVDPDRLIIIDGLAWGTVPSPELADLGVAQSCRAYRPRGVSHYKASWINQQEWVEPAWPIQEGGRTWDRAALVEHYQPWADLAAAGVGVHCGEGGAYRYTPHDVVIRWLAEVTGILKSLNIGIALWNFRGDFGILDSNRSDVDYEDWHGHRLDRALLDLLRNA